MAREKFGRKIRNLIAAFRGLPPDESKSFLKNARPIGDAVMILMKKITAVKVTAECEIHDNWARIVGNDFERRCHPVKILNSDILVIHSASAVIRCELQIKKSEILRNIHHFPHCKKISDIRFIANG
jgi:hypothetical protein